MVPAVSQYRTASDEVPPHVLRFWDLAPRVDRDPGWEAWWRPAGQPGWRSTCPQALVMSTWNSAVTVYAFGTSAELPELVEGPQALDPNHSAPDPDGWVEAEFYTEDWDGAIGLVGALGADVIMLTPDRLRQQTLTNADRLLELSAEPWARSGFADRHGQRPPSDVP